MCVEAVFPQQRGDREQWAVALISRTEVERQDRGQR